MFVCFSASGLWGRGGIVFIASGKKKKTDGAPAVSIVTDFFMKKTGALAKPDTCCHQFTTSTVLGPFKKHDGLGFLQTGA